MIPEPPAPFGSRRPPGLSQLLVGLFVLSLGVLFTLDNLGLADAGRYLRYWPAGLIGLGLVKLWDASEGHGGAFGGMVITLIGLWLLAGVTLDIRLDLRYLWPILLVLLGGHLVWRSVGGPRRLLAADDQAIVSATAVMSGVNRGNTSHAFRGGDLTAVMGGCEIDLRQARIHGDAVMDVFALMGGIELRVPEDWTVVIRVTPFMGGVEDRTRAPLGTVVHRLTIRGLVVMGGIEIKH